MVVFEIDRRGFLGLSAIAVGSLALAGCRTSLTSSGGKSSSGPLSMTIFGNKTDLAVYTERLKLAKKKLPHIDVNLQLVVDNYDQKLQTMISGGTPPDIMHISETVHAFSSRGGLAPLNDLISSAGMDVTQRFGSIGKRYERDGKIWALPDRGGSVVLYYNKDIFDKGHVPYPDGSWTWDDLLEAATKLTVRDGSKFGQFGYVAGDWFPWWSSFMWQNGGEMLDGRKPVLDSQANREGLQFYIDLSLKHRVAPTPVDYANLGFGNSSTDTVFAQGKAGFFTSGYWFMDTARKTKGLRWGASEIYHGKKRAIPANGNGFAIPSGSKRKEDAFAVIEFLTSAEGQKPIAATGEDVPTNLELLASPDYLKPSWNSGPNAVDLSIFAPDQKLLYTPPLQPEYASLLSSFQDGMGTVWTGKEKLDTALPKIQSRWVSLMGSN